MRRQYHSRRTGGRTLIWDVHRLVELTRLHPVRKVAVSSIRELEEDYWFADAPTCREIALHARLIAAAELQYPVILSADGGVMDGMHRVCKALIEGREWISVVQFEADPEPDYIDADIEALPYDEPW